jgi:hypothetical protein
MVEYIQYIDLMIELNERIHYLYKHPPNTFYWRWSWWQLSRVLNESYRSQ